MAETRTRLSKNQREILAALHNYGPLPMGAFRMVGRTTGAVLASIRSLRTRGYVASGLYRRQGDDPERQAWLYWITDAGDAALFGTPTPEPRP